MRHRQLFFFARVNSIAEQDLFLSFFLKFKFILIFCVNILLERFSRLGKDFEQRNNVILTDLFVFINFVCVVR